MFKKFYYQGQETVYSISDDGRVKNDRTGRELKGTYLSNEYHRVSLVINGVNKIFLTHRLVAETFLPNPNNLPVVHHKDGNKYNNKVENLEWVTVKENALHKFETNKNVFQEIDIDDVEWKPLTVDNLENFYEISNNGAIREIFTGKLRRGSMRNGYVRYSLKGKLYSAHKLVYQIFVGEIPNGYVIDHINGDRSDNNLKNLRCITQSENMYNAQRLGHKGQTKVAQYDKNNNLIKEWASFTAAAKELGVTYASISSAAKRGGTSCGYYWKIIE